MKAGRSTIKGTSKTANKACRAKVKETILNTFKYFKNEQL
jgi:hypothetical protein